MKALVLPVLMASLVLAAGCSRDSGDASPAAAAANDAAVASSAASRLPQATPRNHAPVNPGQSRLAAAQPPAQNPRAARDIAPFPETGVPACDAYAQAVEQCLNVHTYGRDRMQLRSAFSRSVKGWQESINAGTTTDVVAGQCDAFRNTFNERLRAVGCDMN